MAILKRFEESKDYVSPAELAIRCAALGERGQAFAALEKAYEVHDPQAAALWGCGFDASGSETACGIVTIDEKGDDVVIVTAQK